jgi:signal transduction histidine kinase
MRLLPTLPLRAWLAVSYLVVLGLPVLALLATGALGRDLVAQTRWDLEHQGALLAMLVEREADGRPLTEVEASLSVHLREAKAQTLTGVRLVDAHGRVIASSGDGIGEDLGADPEVRAALRGVPDSIVRPRERAGSVPLSGPSRRAAVRVFVAVPVRAKGQVVGALVLSRTPREELQALYHMAPSGLLLGAIVALIATLAFAFAASFILSRSLRGVAAGSRRIADGHFDGIDLLEHPKASHLAEVAGAAHSVEAMALRLRERLAYIGEFASHVSHEFKTPLSTLKGTLELLGDDPDMPSEQRARFLVNAAAEVDRLERLVTGLLSLARAEEGQHREILDLDGLIAEVGRRFDVPVRGHASRVRGDRSQLDAVLTNLLQNARVHGGAARLEAFVDGQECGFEVFDDGPGISEANLEHVFDRFFTTNRHGGSSGLGLALVQAVVFAHGGRVEVRSRPGETAFTVRLPAVV